LILQEIVCERVGGTLVPHISDTKPMLNNFSEIPLGVKMTMILEIEEEEKSDD